MRAKMRLKLIFSNPILNKFIIASVTNPLFSKFASQKVVEKAGLKYEGAFYQDYTTYDNQIVDTYCYGISKEEFQRK